MEQGTVSSRLTKSSILSNPNLQNILKEELKEIVKPYTKTRGRPPKIKENVIEIKLSVGRPKKIKEPKEPKKRGHPLSGRHPETYKTFKQRYQDPEYKQQIQQNANTRVMCDCGMMYSKSCKSKHVIIKKHQNWLLNNNQQINVLQ